MTNTATNRKKWLVKSSGMIVGPLSLEEIIQDIKGRRITMIDEVRSPETRWKFIREHQQFTEAIEFARNDQADGKEDTATTFVENLTDSGKDDFTPAPYPVSNVILEAKPIEVVDKADKIVATEKIISPVSVAKIDPKLVKRKPRPVKRSNFPLYFLMFLLLGFLGFAGYQYFPPKQENVRSLGYEDYVRLARSNKSIGNYEKALDFFRKAESIQKLDVANQLSMVPLLMEVESQNVQARQILQALLSVPGLDEKTRNEVHSLIALSYLREGQLNEAQRRYNEIVNLGSTQEASHINLIEIQILQGEFEVARNSISTLMGTGIKDPILLLYRSLASYRLEDNAAKLEVVFADLKRFFSQYQDFHPEVALLQAAILRKMNKDLDAGDMIRRLLSIDPDLTKEHLHDLLVHQEVLGWGYLGNICEILIENGGESPTYKGLDVYCTYRQGDLKQAMEKVEKARARFINDLGLLGLHTFLLYRSGRVTDAQSLLQIPRSGESELAQIVKARLCQARRDWVCAENEWKKVQLRDPQNVSAVAGLGRVALGRGQIELAQDYLKQGLLISGNYGPLLQLKDELNEH